MKYMYPELGFPAIKQVLLQPYNYETTNDNGFGSTINYAYLLTVVGEWSIKVVGWAHGKE